MDPFNEDNAYDSEPGREDDELRWPDSRGTADHHPLMRQDLEISPLIPVVPPMPEGRGDAPGLPTSMSLKTAPLSLQKRMIESPNSQEMEDDFAPRENHQPQQVPHGFSVHPIQPLHPAQAYHPEYFNSSQEYNPMLPMPPAEPSDQAYQQSSVSGNVGGSLYPLAMGRPPGFPRNGNQDEASLHGSSVKSSGDEKVPSAISTFPVPLQPTEHIPGTGDALMKVKDEPAASVPNDSGGTKPYPTNTSDGLSAAKRPNIRDIVVGANFSPTRPSPKAVELSDKIEVKDDSLSQDDNPPLKKKRKTTLKKFLVAKKERDEATENLKNVDDLLDVLPREDCLFLGRECWIFTAQQLHWVLKSRDENDADMGKAMQYRSEILEKLKSATLPQMNSVPLEKPEESITDQKDSPAVPGHGESNVTALSPPILVVDVNEPDDRDRLNYWLQRLETYFQRDLSRPSTHIDKKFPLDGPLSAIIPLATANFLASVPVTHLWRFLAMKKTETGAITDYFSIWRTKCALPAVGSLSLAKHLLGAASRLQTAVTSVPPIDADTRQWMIDPIIIMTGASHDFLVVECKFFSLEKFVQTQTKFLADKLADWRTAKGLEPLKGSGKVAMVSGWKAAAREAILIEESPGTILTDVNFEEEAFAVDGIAIVDDVGVALSTLRSPTVDLSKRLKPIKRKLESNVKELRGTGVGKQNDTGSSNSRQVKYALNTRLFLEDVLGEEATTVLTLAEITTAAELLDLKSRRETSTLQALMVKMELAGNEAECEDLLESWCDRIHRQLEQLGATKDDLPSSSLPPAKKSKTLSLGAPSSQRSRQYLVSTQRDPYVSLSAVTKRFLATMGIVTAEQFLSTRTTDIAAEFVLWREKEGMPELKGLGAVASVSGWKSSCRKAAADMGMDDIAALEPDAKLSWGPLSRDLSKTKKDRPSRETAVEVPVDEVFHPAILGGERSRCALFVFGGSDSQVQYQFQLSVRRPDMSKPTSLFLTYSGAAQPHPSLLDNEDFNSIRRIPVQASEHAEPVQIRVMKDITSEASKVKSSPLTDEGIFAPFSSALPDAGLIDLTGCGVRPIKAQTLCSLKAVIKDFVLGGLEKPACPPQAPKACNVISWGHGFDSVRYLVYVGEESPLERGQTTELCFEDTSTLLGSDRYSHSDFRGRHLIRDSFYLLCREDQDDLVAFLGDELSRATKFKEYFEKVQMDGSTESVEAFSRSCEARRRLHWTYLRLVNAMSSSPPKNDHIYFGYLTFDSEAQSLPPSLVDEMSKLMYGQLKSELLWSLDLDTVAGAFVRTRWCHLAQQTFNTFVSEVLRYFAMTEGASPIDMMGKLKDCLAKVMSLPIDDNHVSDLVMKFSSDSRHKELQILSAENTVPCIPDDFDGGEFIVCTVPCGENISDTGDSSNGQLAVLKSLDDIKSGNATINVGWYRQLQWNVALSVIKGSHHMLSNEERAHFMHGRTIFELKFVAKREIDDLDLKDPKVTFRAPARLPSPADGRSANVPHSFQFFLGLVWPVLRKHHWKLEAGDSSRDVTFSPPVGKFRRYRGLPWRQHRDRKRAQVAREVKEMGLGDLSKLAKRLFVAMTTEENDDSTISLERKGVSAESTFHTFFTHVKGLLGEHHQGSVDAASEIVAKLQSCFSAMAPLLAATLSTSDGNDASEPEPSPSYDVDFVLRFILVLPSILRQAELPLHLIKDCTDVIEKLVDFITLEYKSLLNEPFQPPVEHYAKKPGQGRSELAHRLLNREGCTTAPEQADETIEASQNLAEMTEILPVDEEAGLTDFVVAVMKQAIPCRADEKDVKRGYRRIHIGYPGFVCRHCRGADGEGRYFFKTIESLTTASTVFEKHLLRCRKVPEDIKSRVVLSKGYVVEQRKLLPAGSQQAFFNRLWDRLRSSKIEGILSGVFIQQVGGDAKDGGQSDNSAENPEFTDHVSLLEYIRTTMPWKADRAIQEARNKYYSCLDYGGRIYYTSAMPKSFSAEWLLGKIAPPRRDPRKARMLPG